MRARRGLVLGKFLPYHRGHAHLIREARVQVDELTVLVCSIQREPIPGALRYEWVREAHPDCRVIHVAEEVPQAPEEDPRFWPIWIDLIARYAGPIEAVFTSESYGEELARRLNARHICVDPERSAYPVSGTAVRQDPLGHWAFLSPAVRAHYALRVAILGAESTGKTSLARGLAARFGTVWVPEFGREYCVTRPALTLALTDFAAIAQGQVALEEKYARHTNRVLICDTELHTTAVWSDLIVGARPPGLTAAADARSYHLFILLGDDVPWCDDGTRVFRERRSEHTARLRAELDRANRRYHMITGQFAARETLCEALIERLQRTSSSLPSKRVPGADKGWA